MRGSLSCEECYVLELYRSGCLNYAMIRGVKCRSIVVVGEVFALRDLREHDPRPGALHRISLM